MKLFGALLATFLFVFASPSIAGDKAAGGQCAMEFAIKGMSCGYSCAGKVKTALSSITGIESVKVDYPSKKAYAAAKKGACSAKLQKELESVVSKAGYKCDFVKKVKADSVKNMQKVVRTEKIKS